MESLPVGAPPGTDAQHKPPKAAGESNSLIHIYNLINPLAVGRRGPRGAAGEPSKNK